MTYIALLRGINVGGKSLVKMPALKACFEGAGMTKVTTYLQTGNVIFESRERTVSKLMAAVEKALSTTCGWEIPTVVRSAAQFQQVMEGVPSGWPRANQLRRYMAFLRSPMTASQAMKVVEAREGVDVVTPGNGVLYMSTRLDALSKSRLPKLVGTPVYQAMTIRSYSTCLKLSALVERKV